ncbi:protein FAR1-RELATED SEQUENCE 5-like [Rhodamnia argentea]|uniref:Protein FAR1-RELATED SEQUENCE n=1 Tax=Rhodamnia argentea TaxID=178133 RepID=A0A8B8MPM4_9MYRT|nr:protein FAR1-RELATED SEQUENCE 5-like [Rhodamnia argentea]
MKSGSNFLTNLKKLVYEYVEVKKFEEAWNSLLSTYEASDNSWLQNLYRLKEKWARCYMKSTVTLGIRSTRLSESLNGDLKDYLICNINLNGFFKRFDKVVNDKRYKELQAEFNAREKLPTILCQTSPMLQQAGKVYTPSMFENFQAEWMKILSLVIKERNEMGLLREYVVGSFGANELEYKVISGPSNEVVNCACNHFETVGILCCHALKVLDNLDIKLIPSAYILKRWTCKARDGILEKHGLATRGNGDMDATDRYREVCPEFVKIAVKGSQTIERYEFIKKMILIINKSLDQMPIGRWQGEADKYEVVDLFSACCFSIPLSE